MSCPSASTFEPETEIYDQAWQQTGGRISYGVTTYSRAHGSKPIPFLAHITPLLFRPACAGCAKKRFQRKEEKLLITFLKPGTSHLSTEGMFTTC